MDMMDLEKKLFSGLRVLDARIFDVKVSVFQKSCFKSIFNFKIYINNFLKIFLKLMIYIRSAYYNPNIMNYYI